MNIYQAHGAFECDIGVTTSLAQRIYSIHTHPTRRILWHVYISGIAEPLVDNGGVEPCNGAYISYVYRKRDQSLFYDTAMVLKFIIFLCSNVANALFIVASLPTLYLYIEFNHQRTLKVVAPFPQEHLIEFFFVAAFVMKVCVCRSVV